MNFNYFIRPVWIIVCTLSMVIGSQVFHFPTINNPEKRNQPELHRDKNEGIVVTNNHKVLHDDIDESLNYILPNKDYERDQGEIKTPVLNRLETDPRNDVQHLCVSNEKRTVAKHYKCRSKDFKSFACVGEGGKMGSCNKYFINKQLHEPLCIKKNQFAFVVACDNPRMGGFCFHSKSRKDVLIPCDGGKLRVCYRDYALEDCKTIRKQKIRSHKRRSIQNEQIDPRNIQCSDCEVDILMEVYEGSTPMIEVKIRPLNGKILPQKDSDGENNTI